MKQPENKHRKKVAKKVSAKTRGASVSPPRKSAKVPSKNVKKKSAKKAVDPYKYGERGKPGDNKPVTKTPEEVVMEEANVGFSDGVETLLPIPSRKRLPEIPKRAGRKCKLQELIRHSPHVYSKIIGQIRQGVSLNVASEAVGVSESTFYHWGWLGATDAEKGEDTFYSRFYGDVRRAVASVAADCEMSIAKKSPTKWLAQGAGRIFGNPWGKNGNKRALPGQAGSQETQAALPSPDEVIDGVFTARLSGPVDDDPTDAEEAVYTIADAPLPSDVGTPIAREGREASPTNPQPVRNPSPIRHGQTLQLTPAEEYEALKVWEDIGQIEIKGPLKEAFEQQMAADPE